MPAEPEIARASLVGALVAAGVIATAAAVAVTLDASDGRLILQIALTMIGAIAVWTAVKALRRAAPPAPRSPLDRKPETAEPTPAPVPLDLVRINRSFSAAKASAADARRTLGPLVSAIAADRLRPRAHAPIDAASVYAHLSEPVPAELALVLDPALGTADTRAMPGLDPAGIENLVRALGRLA